jgi:hypothetical protein
LWRATASWRQAGDLFVLYWSAKDKKLYALAANGWSGWHRGHAGKAPPFQTPLNGVYRSGSDNRKDGHAVGW